MVYIVRYNGVLNVFDARSGERKFEARLAGATSAFTSSPIANDGKVYIASEDGQVFVLAAGPTYEEIAMNQMSTPILATPAISEGRMFLRTGDQIMAIGKK
jgi:outer membrane protein assembly factor BamB